MKKRFRLGDLVETITKNKQYEVIKIRTVPYRVDLLDLETGEVYKGLKPDTLRLYNRIDDD